MKEPFQEYYKRWGFFRDLLFNNITRSNQLFDSFREPDKNILNSVMVVVIDNYYSTIFNYNEKQRQAIRFKIYDYIEKGVKNICFSIPVAIEDNIFAIFLRHEVGEASHIDHAVNLGLHLKDYVQKHTGITVSVGIGRQYIELEDLFLSYKEALSATDHKFYLGSGQVIHYENIVPFSENLNFLPTGMHSRLLTKVLTCDLEGASITIEELLRETTNKSVNPFLVKIRFIDSLIDIINNSNPFEVGDLTLIINNIGEQVFKSDTIFELRDQLRKAIQEITKVISLSRKNRNRQIFESAVNYIHHNYQKNITLEDVSKHVHISPYYFSHGFKDFTGMGFVEYLKKVRIEEAKKLLLSTNLSIRTICKRVGYGDPNYFGRVFKSVMGVTPSTFYVNRSAERSYNNKASNT
ncbi:MAG: helix-turn-helix domain-containing protein [Dehalobacterium sp.]